MRCDTSSRPRLDLSQAENPRAVHSAIRHFVLGLRGPRKAPVSRKQIGEWLCFTPAPAVDRALGDLIADGMIRVVCLSLRATSNRTNRAIGYEAPA
jgi:hypothetical protein